MSYPEIVKRAKGMSDWQDVVSRESGELIGRLRADRNGSLTIWDAYDAEGNWLRGFSYQADAVKHLRYRWRRLSRSM